MIIIYQLENAPGKARALDCGAGIGRITKYLLKRHFKDIDLVEQNKKFLEKAVEYLCTEGNDESKHEFFCSGLQNFTPKPNTYDVIWCQWVLGQLTDMKKISTKFQVSIPLYFTYSKKKGIKTF